MLSVKPAPAIIVPSNLPVQECIEQMQKEKSSYVLVENRNGAIAGIFTDRDLLSRFHILKGDVLKKPISVLMSKPVKTLPIRMLHKAAEYMVTNNIRHIPLIEGSTPLVKKLLGIITSDLVLKGVVQARGVQGIFSTNVKLKKHSIGVISPDGTLQKTMKYLFKGSKVVVERLWHSRLRTDLELENAANHYDAIFFDIDNAPVKEWVRISRFFNWQEDLSTYGVVYDPRLHTENVIQLLKKLEVEGDFRVYKKPLDIMGVVHDIESSFH